MYEEQGEQYYLSPLADYSPYQGQTIFGLQYRQSFPAASHYAGAPALSTSATLCRSISAGSGIPGRKASTPRIRLTPTQTSILEQSFQQNPKPNKEIRLTLTKQTGVPFKNVQVWFQNRRAKARAKQEMEILRKLDRSPEFSSGERPNTSKMVMLDEGYDASWGGVSSSPTQAAQMSDHHHHQQQQHIQPATPMRPNSYVFPSTPSMMTPGVVPVTPSLQTPVMLGTPNLQTPVSDEAKSVFEPEYHWQQQKGLGIVAYQPDHHGGMEPSAFTLPAGSGFLKRTKRPPRITDPYAISKDTRIRSATEAHFMLTPVNYSRPMSARSTGGLSMRPALMYEADSQTPEGNSIEYGPSSQLPSVLLEAQAPPVVSKEEKSKEPAKVLKSPVEFESVTSNSSEDIIAELTDIIEAPKDNKEAISADFFELWQIAEADELNLVPPYIKGEGGEFWESAS